MSQPWFGLIRDPLRIARQARPGADRQPPRGERRTVGVNLAHARRHADGGVHHCGEAQLPHVRPGPLDGVDQRGIIGFGHVVVQQAHRPFLKQARQPAIATLDHAALGVRRVVPHPGQRHRGLVGDGHVAAGAADQHRMIGGRFGQFLGGRVAANVQLVVVIPAGQHPGALRGPRRRRPDARQQVVQRADFLGPDVHVQHAEAQRQQVLVGVVEGRDGDAAAQVDPPRRWASQRPHRGAGAHGDDPVAVDCRRLGPAVVQAAPDAALDQRVGVGHAALSRGSRAGRSRSAAGSFPT
jgi:hypothetical protein